MVSPAAGGTEEGVFGIPVNGFHPQLTAVSNPVRPNDVPPPSWPSYVPQSASRRVEDSRNRRRGTPGSTSLSSLPPTHEASTTAPMTSKIDARMTVVVRRLQDDAKETDRSRNKMRRKRVRREERSERRHLKKRFRQQHASRQPRHARDQQRRRTSETSETSFSSTTSSFSTSTGTDATTSSFASSITTASYGITTSASAGSSDAAPLTASIDDETHFSELYSDVFMTSNRPQFLATRGGRLVAWNDEFLAVTGITKAQLSGCMTVHNLVDTKYHAALNDLFELALRGDTDITKSCFASSAAGSKSIQTAATAAAAAVVVASGKTTAMSNDDSTERRIAAAMTPPLSISFDRSISPRSDLSDEKDESVPPDGQQISSAAQYTSLMLPCALPPKRGLARLQVTIVLMNDIEPSRSCFYCLISPMESHIPSSTCGVGGLFPSQLVERPKGIVAFCDGITGLPTLPNSHLNSLGMIRAIGDDELANLL